MMVIWRNLLVHPLNESFRNTFNLNDEQTDFAVKKYREYYRSIGINQNELYDGIKELIIDLKNNNKKVIVATSKPTIFTEKILETHEMKKYFNYISGATLDFARVKKADIISYAIEKNNLKNDECIMVGDRAEDIKGAKENKVAPLI